MMGAMGGGAAGGAMGVAKQLGGQGEGGSAGGQGASGANGAQGAPRRHRLQRQRKQCGSCQQPGTLEPCQHHGQHRGYGGDVGGLTNSAGSGQGLRGLANKSSESSSLYSLREQQSSRNFAMARLTVALAPRQWSYSSSRSRRENATLNADGCRGQIRRPVTGHGRPSPSW